MSEDAATAGPLNSEAVEQLLRQLVDAYFVLTDREGAVTRWSRPAEELFGWPGTQMLGRSLAETLGLDGDLPTSGGALEAVARRKDGEELEVALTFVPVRMSQSLEFNGLLEALDIAAPRGDALAQLQQSHSTVVEWIHSAIEGHATPEEDGLTAGTIVAFRPLVEPPAPAEPAPADGGDPLAPVPIEAPASSRLVDVIEAALDRTEEMERALEGAVADLDGTREEAHAAHDEAASASTRIAEVQRSLDEIAAQVDNLRGGLEHTRVAGEERAREERERLGAEVTELRSAVEGVRRELARPAEGSEELRSKLKDTRVRLKELEQAREQERHSLAEQLGDTRSKLEALERLQVDTAEDGEARRLIEGLRQELAELRADTTQSDELRSLAEEVRSTAAQTLGELAKRSAELGVSDSAREELAALETRVVQTQASATELVTRIESEAARAGERAQAAGEAADALEEGTERARAEATRLNEVVAAVEGRAAGLEERAAAVEARMEELGTLAASAEAAAGTAGQQAERADAAAAAAEGHLGWIRDASGAAERRSERADEAASKASRHADRAGEQAAEAEAMARRMEEAVAAADRRAARAEQAATEAAEAAVLARRAAQEAGIEAGASLRGSDEGRARSYEARRALSPYRSRKAAEHEGEPTANGDAAGDAPRREPRSGFDDATQPMATIELDGHFRELNRGFTDLVGYQEADFKAATWPPVMDRGNLSKHRDQMAQMLNGKIESAEVNTGYVHAQGLMVPVAGTIRLVKKDDKPDHFLLEIGTPT